MSCLYRIHISFTLLSHTMEAVINVIIFLLGHCDVVAVHILSDSCNLLAFLVAEEYVCMLIQDV